MTEAPTAASPRAHRNDLLLLTAAKTSSNTALRWVGPFLPTLERAFSSSTATMTAAMGVCELGGLSTVAAGPSLDRGHERRITIISLLAVAASSMVALIGTIEAFAASFALLVLGVSNLTVAGHAWIGHRIPFAARGRAIGVYETSWAISLLVGAPILAILIDLVGWRGPYVALAFAATVSALVVHVLVGSAPPASAPAGPGTKVPLPRAAFAPMIGSAATAAGGLGTFVVSGAWLDDAYGMSTGGLGTVAAAYGVVELVSSSSVAAFGDRIGARRSVLGGHALMVIGIVVMLCADDRTAMAVTGLLVFITGFEYGFVSSLTLVTEAAPGSRGRAIGVSNGIGTVARAGSVVVSGQLYDRVGMSGTLTLVAVATAIAIVATATSRVG